MGAVLDKVYNSVQQKIRNGSGVTKYLFNVALQSGYRAFDRGEVGGKWYWSWVFGKVRQVVGGRVRVMYTGSAPLSEEIQKYVQTVFGCPVRQAYGLTETCAASFITMLCDNQPNQVGPPGVSTVCRLSDWDEGNYRNSDINDPSIAMRRGEVLIGGPSVCQGYWVDPENPDPEIVEKNKTDFRVINGIRYFHTGDIGQINREGNLQIIDRKKDLFKGPQGEYVSLSKVESVVKLCRYVDMPMVYGRTGSAYVIAIICPNERELKTFAEKSQINFTSVAELCNNSAVIKEVFDACQQVCKQHGLVAFEMPQKVLLVVAPEGSGPAWTPENGLLTAAMKLKRPQIVKAHEAAITALYAQK
eukprot:c5453_g1_i1.p1 GENE.c5453_g1_i1~~c5453_g1_i1.p1  ORF type:complete len:359 (+),score=99.22 c5453_g1_i1:3-1079(+)